MNRFTRAAFALALALPLPAAPASANFWLKSLTAEQLYYRALYLYRDGQTEDAVAALEEAARKAVGDEPGGQRSLALLADIFLAPGDRRDVARAVHALEVSTLRGSRSAAGRLAKLVLDGAPPPKEIKALVPVFGELARESSNSAALLLARLTEDGRLGRKPETPALEWYRLAAERDSKQAMRRLAMASLAAGKNKEALDWVERMGGDTLASFALSVAKDYLSPEGDLAVDQTAALAWFQRALAADPAAAANAAGSFLGIAGDAERAKLVLALRGAADKGDPTAAFLVARLLDGDDGSIGDEALGYYLAAAAAGNADAIKAVVKVSGFLPQDDPRAGQVFEGIRAAAEKGNTEAMLALGNYYGIGALTGRDLEESLAWYLRAAQAGIAEAQFRAGLAFAEGLGTEIDKAEARRWLTAANEQRYPLAAASLVALDAAP